MRSHQKFYFKTLQGHLCHQRVDKIWIDHAPELSQNVCFRNATKGTLKAQVLVIKLCDNNGNPNSRSLVISCDATGALKYSLTNAQGSAHEHCYRQHQRYWVERAIQEAKSEVGMAQYQVRGWDGWHQHIAMVALAMLFALQQKNCLSRLHTATEHP